MKLGILSAMITLLSALFGFLAAVSNLWIVSKVEQGKIDTKDRGS